MMKKLLKGGTVVSGSGAKRADLLIENEKIVQVGRKLETDGDTQVVDVTGCLLSETDGGGNTTTYTYDDADRVKT